MVIIIWKKERTGIIKIDNDDDPGEDNDDASI